MSAQAQPSQDSQPLIRLRGITKVYGEGALAFQALKGVDLDIAAGEQERRIWVLQNQQPVPVSVRTGISDGRRTEVSGAQLREGVAVIIDQKAQ